jgi:DASS family divalent anion:Na+ symporter
VLLSSAAIPNPTGRVTLVAPLTLELAEAFDYAPGSRRAAGLALAALMGFGKTYAPFLTSSTTALLAFTLLPQHARSGLTWGIWALRAAPLYLILLAGMYAFILWYYGQGSFRSGPRARQHQTDVLLLQRSLLGPPSSKERIAGLVTIFLVIGFVTEPLHHVDPVWIAIAAAGTMAATGVLTAQTLQTLNWSYILLFGTLTSTASVFATTGLDHRLAGAAGGLLAGAARTPFLFVALLVLVCFGVSLVLQFAAAAPLLIIALTPMAVRVGIDPWVVAIVALVGTGGFLLRHQSSGYQAMYHGTGGTLFTHRQARPAAIAYQVLALVAVCASVPVWHAMGLL